MRPTDNLSKSFKELRVPTSRQLDESVFSEISRAVEKSVDAKQEKAGLGIFRAIFKARIIRLAATAFLIVAIIGLHQFRNSIKGTSIAWADVVERLEKVRSYKAKARRVLTEVGQEEPFFEGDILRYFSPKHGSVEESYDDGELVMLAYCSLSEQAAIVVFPPPLKMYCRFDLNEELLSMVEYVNPANTDGIMKEFGTERCVRLGRKEIDGVIAEGFEVKDVKILSQVPEFFLHTEDMNIRVWVNEETLLPIRIEGEGFFTGLMALFKKCRYKEVMYDIEYDAEIDESIFDPNIPDDYMLIDPADITVKAELVMLGILPFSFIGIVYKHFKKKRRNKSHSAGSRGRKG